MICRHIITEPEIALAEKQLHFSFLVLYAVIRLQRSIRWSLCLGNIALLALIPSTLSGSCESYNHEIFLLRFLLIRTRRAEMRPRFICKIIRDIRTPLSCNCTIVRKFSLAHQMCAKDFSATKFSLAMLSKQLT